jgi:polyferredoxin
MLQRKLKKNKNAKAFRSQYALIPFHFIFFYAGMVFLLNSCWFKGSPEITNKLYKTLIAVGSSLQVFLLFTLTNYGLE